jgi:hypothetical protein
VISRSFRSRTFVAEPRQHTLLAQATTIALAKQPHFSDRLINVQAMDSFLPQMETFDFDRLDPIALEQTLAYLKAHPEPEDFQAMMDDAVAEKDWLDDGMQDSRLDMGMGGQSR